MDQHVSTDVTTHKTFCRFCHAACAVEVDVKDNRPVALRGDPDDPEFGGYTCIKGRALPDQHNDPNRLTTAMKKRPDGSFEPIPTQQALDEIAAKLIAIRDKHGPRAIASYMGTYAFQSPAALPAAKSWHVAIDSPSYYTSVTIDQPAKVFMGFRFGQWSAGLHVFRDADVTMMIGNNPIVSQYAPIGSVPPFSPSRRIRDAKERGMKLIVVDPRKTEVARLADIHLPVRPGEDPTLVAGLLHIVLAEDLIDHDFCDRWVDGLDDLRDAVKDFTPDYVAARCDVPKHDLIAAARLFAAGPRGTASTGTGPEMAPRGSLTDHLVRCLNTVLGRYYREGEESPIPRVLTPVAGPRKAQVTPPQPVWGEGFPKSRIRGLTMLGIEMPTAVLADEILLPGEGQIRALFNVGGNPIVAWPDQDKTRKALESLDLLVSIDIKLQGTSTMADYVLPAMTCLEREDVPTIADWWFEGPYSRYTEAVVEPGPELIDEWEVYWELGKRMGVAMAFPGGVLPLDRKPSKFEVFETMLHGMAVPLDKIRAATKGRGGQYFPEAKVMVEPADPDADGKFAFSPPGVLDELRAVRAEALDPGARPFRLTSRRLKHVFNSVGFDLPTLKVKGTHNAAYMNPDDMAALGLATGDIVELQGEHATILGIAEAADDIRRGVVSMAHGHGPNAGDVRNLREIGSSTNLLVRPDVDYDPITGMAQQSAIPVAIKKHVAAAAAE